MTRMIPVKDDFPDGFYEAFARVIIEFGRLEYLLKLCIKDIHAKGFDQGMLEAESKRQFEVLCRHANANGRKYLTSDEADAFDLFIEEARKLADYRNDTVHAFWTVENGSPVRIRPIKKDGAVDWSLGGAVSVEELDNTAREIQKLCSKLDESRLAWSVRSNSEA